MRVLKLDRSFRPVEIIPWTEAMRLLFLNKAEAIENYKDRQIRSVNSSYPAPCVIRVLNKTERLRKLCFTRENVYQRDNYQCQYCTGFFPKGELTLDHVMPLSRGGPKNWENIVTACSKCNLKKGDKTPGEMGWSILNPPKKPGYSPKMILRITNEDPEEWLNYVTF